MSGKNFYYFIDKKCVCSEEFLNIANLFDEQDETLLEKMRPSQFNKTYVYNLNYMTLDLKKDLDIFYLKYRNYVHFCYLILDMYVEPYKTRSRIINKDTEEFWYNNEDYQKTTGKNPYVLFSDKQFEYMKTESFYLLHMLKATLRDFSYEDQARLLLTAILHRKRRSMALFHLLPLETILLFNENNIYNKIVSLCYFDKNYAELNIEQRFFNINWLDDIFDLEPIVTNDINLDDELNDPSSYDFIDNAQKINVGNFSFYDINIRELLDIQKNYIDSYNHRYIVFAISANEKTLGQDLNDKKITIKNKSNIYIENIGKCKLYDPESEYAFYDNEIHGTIKLSRNKRHDSYILLYVKTEKED